MRESHPSCFFFPVSAGSPEIRSLSRESCAPCRNRSRRRRSHTHFIARRHTSHIAHFIFTSAELSYIYIYIVFFLSEKPHLYITSRRLQHYRSNRSQLGSGITGERRSVRSDEAARWMTCFNGGDEDDDDDDVNSRTLSVLAPVKFVSCIYMVAKDSETSLRQAPQIESSLLHPAS